MFEATAGDRRCSLARPGARWLATGWNGGYATADVACNLTVPADFDRTDLASYVSDRLDAAGLPDGGPALLTGVDAAHARGARAGTVTVVATAGLTNPAALPMEPGASAVPAEQDGTADGDDRRAPPPGTVNVLVGTTRALDDGTLAELLATAVEAKTATLVATTGFTGTTSDAVAVGTDRAGDPAAFAGSDTAVGAATRACVRDAVRASLAAGEAGERSVPASVTDAEHGTVTTTVAETFCP